MPFLFATLWMPVDIGSGVKTYEQNPHFGLKLHRSIIGLKYYVLYYVYVPVRQRQGLDSSASG